MEPRIQYTRTSDGVSIAYSVTGEGPPLVLMPGQVSHLALAWDIPQSRRWLERIGRGRTLVRYDGRGTGLSERNTTAYSLDALVADLKAVVAAARLERFDIFGMIFHGAAAIEYATRYPEHVAHLVLWCACTRGVDFWRSPRVRAVRAVRETDWELYAESMLKLVSGPDTALSEEEVRGQARMILEGGSPASLAAFMDATQTIDVADRLPLVRCPTLVLHGRQVAFLDVSVAQEIASRIPNAELAVIEGAGGTWRSVDSIGPAVDAFLGVAPGVESLKEDGHRLVTLLFTDVEGSTALTQRLGDAAARAVLREHERITRQALRAHGGSEVKTMGDGFMASFGSATKALECAIAIQRAFASVGTSLSARPEVSKERAEHDTPIRVRIGLNAGEPIAEANDLHGTAVITAARIAVLAQGGEILVSDVVRQLVAGKGFLFNDRGDHALKGFEDPVRVWEVKLQRGEE